MVNHHPLRPHTVNNCQLNWSQMAKPICLGCIAYTRSFSLSCLDILCSMCSLWAKKSYIAVLHLHSWRYFFPVALLCCLFPGRWRYLYCLFPNCGQHLGQRLFLRLVPSVTVTGFSEQSGFVFDISLFVCALAASPLYARGNMTLARQRCRVPRRPHLTTSHRWRNESLPWYILIPHNNTMICNFHILCYCETFDESYVRVFKRY